MIEAITEVQPSVALFNLPTSKIEYKEGYEIEINESAYLKALDRLPNTILKENRIESFYNEDLSSKTFNILTHMERFALEHLSREEEILYFRALRFFEFILDPKEGIEQLEKDRLTRLNPSLGKKKKPKIPFFEQKENVFFFQLLNEKVGLHINTNIDVENEENLYQILSNDNVLEIDKKRYRKGAREIINSIITEIEFSNILLVKSISRSIKHPFAKNNLEDIFQEGFTSMRAYSINKFNHTLGFRFSTYAVPWIKRDCMTYIENFGRTIRAPSHKIKLFSAMSTIINEEGKEQESHLNDSEQNNILLEEDYSKSQIADFFNSRKQNTRSLDSPYKKGGEEGDHNLYSFIIRQNDPASNLLKEKRRASIIKKSLTSGLTKKEFLTLYIRSGFLTGEKITQEDTSDIIGGITRARVFQLEKSGQRKIRNRSKRKRTGEKACTPLFNNELEARNHIILHYWIPYIIKKSFTQSEKKDFLMKKVYPFIEMYYGLNGRGPLPVKEISLISELSPKETLKKIDGIKSILKSTTIPSYILPTSPTYHGYLEDIRSERIPNQP